MEVAIMDSLEDLGYKGEMLTQSTFEKAIDEGLKSVVFTQTVEWLTKELAMLNKIEDNVRQISEINDADNFLMEVSGFLREYGCPYSCLVEGPMNQRLSSRHDCLLLLNYLTSELQASNILLLDKPQFLPATANANICESTPVGTLRQLLITLGFPKPPEGITSFQLFTKVENKIKELMGSVEGAHLGNPLVKASLSSKQWEGVSYINDALNVDSQLRQTMLQQRLDVTYQSFLWSDFAKKNEVKLKSVYEPLRLQLENVELLSIAHLLAARDDLLRIEKTSSGTSRDKTKCELNKHIIGKVPDRGGRAHELEPPPPEMPSFQQRSQGPPSRGGGDRRGQGRGDQHERGRGGHNDDRNVGNWGQNQSYYAQEPNAGNAFFGGGQQQYGGGQQQYGGGQQQYGGYDAGGYQNERNQGGNYNRGGQDGYSNDNRYNDRGQRSRGRGRSRGYH